MKSLHFLLVRATCLGALLTLTVAAQMAGQYTVDNTAATSGTNFQTLQEMASALRSPGINGPVTVTVRNTGTPYSDFQINGFIPGSRDANPILISAEPGTQIVATNTSHESGIYLFGVRFVPSTGPISIEGFEVSGANGVGILIWSCARVQVRNCSVSSCGSGVAIITSSLCEVRDCRLDQLGDYLGVSNEIHVGAITVLDPCIECTVASNSIRRATSCGIFVGGWGSQAPGQGTTVINNFISETGPTVPWRLYGGIALRQAEGTIVAHNSISMPSNIRTPGLLIEEVPLPALVMNNIVRHEGSGPVIRQRGITVPLSGILDGNHYDQAGSGPFATSGGATIRNLASWQAVTSADATSFAGPAGFVSSTDLRLLPSSASVDSALPTTSALVTTDIDGTPRAIGAAADRGADEVATAGLVAAFTVSQPRGSAPFRVEFRSAADTSEPGGVTTWDWDLDGDGVTDSTLPNPTFSYACPGIYPVRLTVTDGSPASATTLVPAAIMVDPPVFGLSSMGMGDLTIRPVPTACYPTATEGYTIVSLNVSGPVGQGPLGGLYPDPTILTFLASTAAVGNPVHFLVSPGAYPDQGSLSLSVGSLSALSGITLDAVQIFLDAQGGLPLISNVIRITL